MVISNLTKNIIVCFNTTGMNSDLVLIPDESRVEINKEKWL